MTRDRIALRPNEQDVANLSTIAAALDAARPAGSPPWTRSSITQCLLASTHVVEILGTARCWGAV
jgi:hypothetical protein